MKDINPFLLLLLVVVLLVSGCSKEGDPGPKGDKGDPGTTGAKGDKGDKGDEGEQGQKGTANVMYSPWFKYAVRTGFEPDFRYYYMHISVPQITADFKNNGGIVLVYRGYSFSGAGENVGEITHLPSEGVQGGVYWTNSFRYGPGFVDIEYVVTGGIDKITSREDFLTRWSKSDKYLFRYILIPGGELINARIAIPLNYENYASVKAYYYLPD